MGNTANNNWPYPESTDLVKDGATAIENLADAIDTTLGVFVPSNPGLTLINTTSFSGVSSQSVNDVFSATYDNYKILVDQVGTANSDLDWRFRVSGADDSSAVYCFQFSDITTVSTLVSNRTTNGTSGRITPLNNASRSRTELQCYTPFLTRTTSWYSQSTKTDGTTPTTAIFSGVFTNTTSFTGFTLLPQSGTITGTISVYGFNK
jgi:hypothetical protein